MSIAICDYCTRYIDTDDDPECYEAEKDKCICESCRDRKALEEEQAEEGDL